MALMYEFPLGSPLDGTQLNGNFELIEASLLDIGPYVISGLDHAAGTGLSVDVTAGTATIGGRVEVADPFTISGLAPNDINHLYLLNTGAGASNTTGTQPANSVKLGRATTDGSSVTSVDEVGRQEKAEITDIARLSSDNTFTGDLNLFSGGGLRWEAPVAGSSPVSYAAQSVDSTIAYLTTDTTPNSGARGLHLQKKSDNGQAVGITLEWDTEPLWDVSAIDFASADLVMAYDHSANSGAGADVMRVSREADATGPAGSPKFAMGRVVGTPEAQTSFLLLDGGDNTNALGGLAIRFWGGATVNALALTQRDTAHNRATLAFGDTSEVMWLFGTDIAAANNKNFTIRDNVNSRNRFLLINENTILPRIGIGSSNPGGGQGAIVAVTGSTDSSLNDTPQRYLVLTSADVSADRGSIVAEAIRNATGPVSRQFLWLNGRLGGGSTAATPVTTTNHGTAAGLECHTDGVLSLIVAPTGGNQTISRVVSADYSGAPRLSFFGLTPVARAAAYTPTNVSTDRSFDANSTTLDEIADVLGTLIADLQSYGLLQ